jgi:hypothetical protein
MVTTPLGVISMYLFQFLSRVIYLDWREHSREHSRQLDPKWRASLYRLLLFLSRYGTLDLDWGIGVDLTSDPRHASPNRSLDLSDVYTASIG